MNSLPPQHINVLPDRIPATRSWWRRLSRGRRIGLIALGVLALLIGIGSLAPKPATPLAADSGPPAAVTPSVSTASQPQNTATQPQNTATPPPSVAAPVVTTTTVTETVAIAFNITRTNDPSLPKGQTRIRTQGVAGSKTVTYQITLTDGKQTAKKAISSVVTREPVTQVIAVGTKAASNCDPNYDPCVPIASDVDCAGGTGDGPAYVQGPVYVIGTDVYKLDSDHDGIGCE